MRPSRIIATWFGAGLVPHVPGTVGTLATVPVYALLCALRTPPWSVAAAAAGALGLGILTAGRLAKERGIQDPPEVVIDEVAGFLVACSFAPRSWQTAVAAFVLFRALDMLKPGPIAWLERLPGGWGVMMDDLAAGLLAGGLVALGWGLLAGRWGP